MSFFVAFLLFLCYTIGVKLWKFKGGQKLKELYELTNPQKSIWVTEEFYKGTSIENIAGITTIKEKVDFSKLKKAINIFVRNAESSRLKFVNDNNIVKQYISDYVELDFEVVDVESEKDVKRLGKECVNTSFELFNSLMFRFKFFKFKDGHGGFIVVGHHLLIDAWACGLAISNILRIYDSLVQNIEFKEESFSYLDFIKSEQEYLSSDKYVKDKNFWNEQFKSIPELATVPGSLQSTEISSIAKRKQFKIPASTMDLINAFCKDNKISPFNFFMSIYSIYISHATNLDEFVIATPVLNRSNVKEKHTIGMFISVVPFKVNINYKETFVSFAKSMASNFFSVFKHQKYPYQTLLEDLRKQNPKTPNLYNVMLSYQNMRTETKTTGIKYETDWLFNGNISDDMDIHFFDINDSGTLTVAYDYKVSKYTADDIYAFHSRILNIINQILENNNVLLKDIEIVTPEEKEQLLYGFNNTQTDYPKNKTIAQLFEEQVERTPDNIAVIFGDRSLTYKELNEKSNSLANYLRSKKVGKNSLVGIMVNRSLEMIVSVMAVLKAGGAYIPIDPTYPKDRVEYMLSNSNAIILLTQKQLENKINFKNKILVDLNNSEVYSLSSKNIKTINSPEDLAYVIFTSGSTGLPKGVMLKQMNIVNFIYGMMKEFKFTSKDVIASITTISFDIFVLESLMPLLNGLKIVIANENEQTDVALFNKLCVKNHVNIFQTTPSRMQIFTLDDASLDFIKNATHILIGGEPFPVNLLTKFSKLTKAKIYNMYGPTETAVWSSLKQLDYSGELITIGTPIINTQIYILDKNLKPVPVGIPGEIYISGDGVGHGYLNKIELTQKSFIENPFIPGTIMYKTGDLGLFQENGEIICLGRSDNQIKIRGLRIELGEIEGKISEISSIKACAVVKKVDELSHEFLCAYYTCEGEIDIKIIREHLQKYLPNYMIPQYFTKLDALPYTPNGKIDAKKLPMPEANTSTKEIVLPRNEIDKKLLIILQDLLNISSISIEDNFFELGGDSLSAINLCTQIQSQFHTQIFVKDILEHPVIKNISHIISKNSSDVSSEIIVPVAKAEYYPVSSAQKRMYFASQVAGDDSVLYNIPGGIIIEGFVDVDKLNNAFKALINRHESLRTYFDLIDNTVVQKISNSVDFKLDVINNISFDNLDEEFKSFLKPFDLSQAPLFRAKLINFNNEKFVLFIDIHHIIADGTSLNILIDELCKLYNGHDLEKLNITYKDFASFESQKISSGKLQEAEDFWMSKFQGEIPVLNIPTKAPRPAVQSFDGKKVYSYITAETISKINNVSKTLGITPYMLFLACYYILLSKYSNQNDIIVGTPIVGRDVAETQNLIGMFVNTLALREKIDPSLTFKAFLIGLKENLLTSYQYQTFPFDELVNKLDIKRDTSRNPLFDTMFIYQNTGFKDMLLGNTTAKYYIPNVNISKFDLSLEIIPMSNKTTISFEYSTKLFDETFIKNMAYHYLNILHSILENSDVKISEIDMLSEEERNTVLYKFNNTKMDYGRGKTISQLFEEQVLKTPNNTAVIFGNEMLTFKELNEKANSLANYIRSQGIKTNDLVGFMVHRSLEVIVAMLAILKAGAAYIPIDPAFPSNRIDYMIESSKAKLLLTEKSLFDKVDVANKVAIDLNPYNPVYQYSTDNLKVTNSPEDLVYVIFTSGSTGKPKGVMVTHKVLSNFTNYCNDCVKYLKNPENLSIVSITTVSFDIFAYETLISLQKGLCVVVANENEQTTPQMLNDLMEKNNVQIIQSTPSVMQIFMNNLSNMPAFKKLKYVVLAGEQLPLELVQELHKIGPIVVYNGYGPSETYYSSLTEMNDDIITIGKPIYNSQMYILDNNLKPLPIGLPGEIYISGECVGKGYLNNAALTAKSFIKNPYLPNTIMYKSGDLGLFTAEGDIICLGRSDHQVKIRGLRIELEEVEALIKKYPSIEKVTVIKQSINNREFLSAYYVANKRIVANSIRKYLLQNLPKYMVPSYYVALNDLPYTPNGKIDRNALPLPTEILKTSVNEYVAPQTGLQKILVNLFEKTLNTKPIGINDNFFELGGDSLLAMNLNIELQKLSSNITYSDIFHFPTVAELEDRIYSKNSNDLLLSKIDNLPENLLEVMRLNKKREKIKSTMPKNVLITGATGFLGIHIVEEFLRNSTCNIYCIIREEPGMTSRLKLHQKLNYYFGSQYDDLIDKRLFAITGDILKPGFGLDQGKLLEVANSVDIIINSAARVAHYGNYKDFCDSNVKSVKFIIDFCKQFGITLFHISTTGVAGTKLDLSYPSFKKKIKNTFDESSLYVGQVLDNVYTRSKFDAEHNVLNAISEGLNAYILRMGNLMPRYYDGVFQENILDNAFINRLLTFIQLGIIPDNILKQTLEFTPVDFAARSVFKIVTNRNSKNRVFHLFDYHTVSINRYLRILKECGFAVQALPEVEFKKQIDLILHNEDTKNILNNLINDFDKNLHLSYKPDIIIVSKFSIRYLRRLCFKWPKITHRYLTNFIKLLKKVI